MSEIPFREPGRRTPAKGVHVSLGGPNWVFLTVCTEKRERWLAQTSAQRALHDIWERMATAWLVSDYLLMPDHLHLFCAPHDLKFTIERWMGFWKGALRRRIRTREHFRRAVFITGCARARTTDRNGNMCARIRCAPDWWCARRIGRISDACMRFIFRRIENWGGAAVLRPTMILFGRAKLPLCPFLQIGLLCKRPSKL